MPTVQLQLVPLSPGVWEQYLALSHEIYGFPYDGERPPEAGVFVAAHGALVLGCRLTPSGGVIFATGLVHLPFAPGRVKAAALQLAIQAVVMTSTCLQSPVACEIPKSKAFQKLLMRAGWAFTTAPRAMLVREPGLTLTRRLPGRRS